MPHSEQPHAPAPLGSDPLTDVVDGRELPKLYPQLFPNRNTLPWLMRRRDTNGLAEHLRWVGRTAYISKSDFAAWFRSRATRPATTEAQRRASSRNVAIARAARVQEERRRPA